MVHRHSADLVLLQRTFLAVGDELAGRYVALHDGARDEHEKQCWLDRVIDVREQKRAVGATDREALSRCIGEWSETLEALRSLTP
ncbi:hypothetical protein ABZ249_24655 [Nocardiopsis sp. NPDC006139]|uniref:hypothetical protein n=1 Tax=unclassified Nocardiopsis TaxID=2649073 RepID=UPI0033B19CE6